MERMLRAEEIADLLKVSKGYVYLLISRGELPSFRVGRVRRVRLTDLEAFITDNSYLGETKIPQEKESVP